MGTLPLLVPPIEALACAHLHRKSNVQSPRIYADIYQQYTMLFSAQTIGRIYYIPMNIYHCRCLDEDLKLPDFNWSRTETLINVFSNVIHPTRITLSWTLQVLCITKLGIIYQIEQIQSKKLNTFLHQISILFYLLILTN